MSDWETVGNENDWETISEKTGQSESDDTPLARFIKNIIDIKSSMKKKDYKSAMESTIRAEGQILANIGATGGNKMRSGEEFTQGLGKGASLNYLNPVEGEGGLASTLGEFVGGFAPYQLAGAALSATRIPSTITKAYAKAPAIGNIINAGLPMATVGFARPAKNIEERAKRSILEGGVGMTFQGVSEGAKALAPLFRQGTAKALAPGLQTDPEIIDKTLQNPKKYTQKPMNQKEELAQISKIKDKVVKNVDDLTRFRVRTLEDKVADQIGGKQFVDPKKIKADIRQYVMERNARNMTALTPKETEIIGNLYKDIDKVSTKNGIKFIDAHKLKQTIYKVMSSSYDNSDWNDTIANAYKIAANNTNTQLRVISKPYESANDKLAAIYALNERAGTKGGFPGLEDKVGSSKKFKTLINDPEGRKLIEDVESVMPKKKKFMPELNDLEETQAIRKMWSQKPTYGLPGIAGGAGGLGSLTYMATKNIPLTLLAGTVGGALTNPRAIKQSIQLADSLSRMPKPSAENTARGAMILKSMLENRQ